MEMKTLTVNGKTYIVADPDAAHFDNSKPGNGAWSGKNTVDQLCPTFTESGSVVSCHPVEGYPLDVVSRIEPVQEGEGDPSPENIRPISGHTKVTLRQHCGKNHIPTDITNADSWQVADNHAYYKAYYLPELTKGRQYTFSVAANTEGASNYLYLQKYINNTWITMSFVWAGSAAYKAFTFTAEDTAYRLWISNPNVVPNIAYAQLEEGTVATSYEPYQGDTFTAQLGQTVYGGALDWQTGVLTVDKQYITVDGNTKLIGYSSYDKTNSTNRYVTVNHGFQAYSLGTPPGLCDTLKLAKTKIWDTDTEDVINAFLPNSYTQLHMNISNSVLGITTEDDNATRTSKFSAYCAEHPIHFVMPMAEPITVQLDPQEILALSGTNTIYSDTGDTQVSGKADLRVTIEKLTNAIIALGGKV